MEVYIANLLREKSATTIVFVKDDAASSGLKRKLEFKRHPSELSGHQVGKWLQPSSLKKNPESNSAPICPTRRESNDTLCMLSMEEKLGKAGFISKVHGSRPRTMTSKREKKVSAWKKLSLSKQHTAGGGGDDTTVEGSSLEISPQHHCGQDMKKTRSSPITHLKRLLKNIDPPTLPLRRTSDDNFLSRPQTEELLNRQRSSRSSSFDHSYLLPTTCDLRQGSYLDNTVMIVPEHTEHHPIEGQSSSLDEVLLLSDEHKRQSVQRGSSQENGAGASLLAIRNQKRQARRRSGSLDNAFLSVKDTTLVSESFLDKHQDPIVEEKCDDGEGSDPLRASVSSNMSEAPKPERNLKQRLLDKLNSPRWKSKKGIQLQISSDVFQIQPNLNKEYSCNDSMPTECGDDIRFGMETPGSSPLLPCRRVSDLRLSVLSEQ